LIHIFLLTHAYHSSAPQLFRKLVAMYESAPDDGNELNMMKLRYVFKRASERASSYQ